VPAVTIDPVSAAITIPGGVVPRSDLEFVVGILDEPIK
jgi:hypothetical protein